MSSSRVLDGQIAIVTGAASGIGRATALRLARDGAGVAVADSDLIQAEMVAEEVARDGGRAIAVLVDVASRAAVVGMTDHVVRSFGRLDILVNNAGIGVSGDVVDTSEDDLERLLAVNVKGVFFSCQAAIPHMLDRGGSIVNVASAAALAAVQRRAAYIATKGAIVALTRSIAVDFMLRGIRCNAVAPGTVDSPWIGRIVADQPDPQRARKEMTERQPLGRLGRPEEIASAIAYLVSPEASFVHGSCLVVDGGFSAR